MLYINCMKHFVVSTPRALHDAVRAYSSGTSSHSSSDRVALRRLAPSPSTATSGVVAWGAASVAVVLDAARAFGRLVPAELVVAFGAAMFFLRLVAAVVFVLGPATVDLRLVPDTVASVSRAGFAEVVRS